ncbi:MAG: glycosyltransferase family 2 protein [Candidatus Omnitrophica bacterium]|nr:glycosyltransferase family 2 protein [Candidatus Omnitrophota bacterium]
MEKVSVGIPTYNSGKYIRDCLASILSQTYHNLEIIVVDNGSSDDTERIVFSFKDPRVRFYRNPKNIFCYGSYNVIIKLAQTELLAIYHSDDVYEPTIIEEQVKFLKEHKNVVAVFTEAYIINSEGKIIRQSQKQSKIRDISVFDFRLAYNMILKYGDFFICPSGMFVKKVFEDVGLFKEEKFFSTTDDDLWIKLLEKYGMSRNMILTANDLEMWLRILQKYPVGILHKKLMRYRIHPGQGSFSDSSTSRENFFIVMDYYERYAREKKLISEHALKHYMAKKVRWIFSKGQDGLLRGDFSHARRNFISFIKNFCSIFPFWSFRDFSRLFWASSVVVLNPRFFLFKKILEYYLDYKVRQQQKKMSIL